MPIFFARSVAVAPAPANRGDSSFDSETARGDDSSAGSISGEPAVTVLMGPTNEEEISGALIHYFPSTLPPIPEQYLMSLQKKNVATGVITFEIKLLINGNENGFTCYKMSDDIDFRPIATSVIDIRYLSKVNITDEMQGYIAEHIRELNNSMNCCRIS